VLIAWPSHSHGTGPQSTLLGDTLVFVSLVTALVMILVTKHLMSTYGALYLTSFLLILGTVALIIYAEIFHPIGWHHSARTWTAIAAQGVLATAGAYFLWNWGLQHTSASRAGVFLNLEPVMGTLLGVGVLHETLGFNTIVGGLLILASAGYFSMKSGT
jgi:drug/metabolite transporter (DMT)-like permease